MFTWHSPAKEKRPRYQRLMHWHQKFAWLPTRTGDYIVWLRYYWRKGVLHTSPHHCWWNWTCQLEWPR
jgi:hypothetical protein